MRHNIEVVIDRLVAGPKVRPRLAEAVELALRLGEGNLVVAVEEEGEKAEGGRRKPERRGSAKRRSRSRQRAELPPPQSASPSDISLLRPLRLHPLPAELRAAQPAAVQLQQSAGHVSGVQRPGADLHVRSRAADSRPEPLVPAGLRSSWWAAGGRWAAGGGTSTAAWPRRSSGSTAWRRAPCWKPPGRNSTRSSATPCSGAPARSTSRSPGGAGRRATSGAAPSKASSPSSSRSTAPPSSRIAAPPVGKVHARSSAAAAAAAGGSNPQACAVTLTTASPRVRATGRERSLPEVCALAVAEAEEFFCALELDATGQAIAAEALKEIRQRLQFLKNVGLDYLSLDRTAPTLAGGEMQRIRLAGQIGCGLVGVLYILDEPSIGLHPRDNDRLLETLARLRDQGNTVVVVEHDEDTMRAADHVVDFGPGPGVRGGRIVAAGAARRTGRRARERHRAVSLRPAADRGPRRPPRRRQRPRPARRPRRPPQQPQEHRRRNPAGRVRVRHGRLGLGQELAGERHPGRGPAAATSTAASATPATTTASRAWSTSTS